MHDKMDLVIKSVPLKKNNLIQKMTRKNRIFFLLLAFIIEQPWNKNIIWKSFKKRLVMQPLRNPPFCGSTSKRGRCCSKIPIEMDKQTFFFKVRESEIRKFSGSFHYRKSANVLCMQVRKFLRHASPQTANPKILIINSQIANPLISTNTTQLCLKRVLNVVFLHVFFIMYKF